MSQFNPSDVYDVASFCKANKISRALFYQLVKTGKGPRLMKVARRTLITPEANADWRKEMESRSVGGDV